MKLRTRGRSIRLRLTRTEVARLAAGERVEERVPFGPGTALVYGIGPGEVPTVEAHLDGAHVRVVAPLDVISTWASSDAVGFDGRKDLGDGTFLTILVEKDWNCLTSRPGEEDVDTFPNPSASC
ncbi:MAG: hypothetical protein IPK71_13375 [Myxococcales bacterium]|jgi:hypothetical protein|nr:hypothetical protein [Myxococcales bacterium]